MGYIVPEYFKFPGYLSPSLGLKFSDVPNGLAALSKIPVLGGAQIIAFCGLIETTGFFQASSTTDGRGPREGQFSMKDSTESAEPGNYGVGFPNFLGKVEDPEARKSKLAAELANGRLAMMAIIGMFFQDGLTGSAWGDWALYTASPLRAEAEEEAPKPPPFDPAKQVGAMAPLGFFDPAGFAQLSTAHSFGRGHGLLDQEMPAMELMAAMGLAGAEVFRYNRENFEFDQEQRFSRDEVRVKMQVELFNLFREDIRDLVEMTTSKMNLYHLVGALFIKMICIYFCEGFFEEGLPPFLLCYYYMSQGSSVVYLIMAVWLSMHASVTSHSYATRVLTRFIRLPIPGSSQLNVLNARFADFERQGRQMLRIPFLNKANNNWQDRPQLEVQREAPPDQLGAGIWAYGGLMKLDVAGYEEDIMKAVHHRTQRHIQLFRRLQALWQCYDAYARVCMSLGVRMMLQGISYYLLGICWVQINAPYVAAACAVVFQFLALNLAALDIHGVNDLSLIGALPCLCAIMALACAQRTTFGALDSEQPYVLTLIMYPLEVLWFEMLHWLASPMGDAGFLPRQFKSVLFMDVFSDLNEAGVLTSEEKEVVELRRPEVQKSLNMTRAAIRRWEAVPRRWLTLRQYRQRKQLLRSYNATADTFVDFMEKLEMPIPVEDDRPWADFPTAERRKDPFSGTVLGPFSFWFGTGVVSTWFYDIENRYRSQNGVLLDRPSSDNILDLDSAMAICMEFKRKVEMMTHGTVDETSDRSEDSDQDVGEGSRISREDEKTPLRGRGERSQADPNIQVNRLPWNLVSFVTRTIQLVWLALGIAAILRETKTHIFDWQVSHIVEERRLAAVQVSELVFQPLNISWPYGGFFSPEAVSCQPNGAVFVGSTFAQYTLLDLEDPIQLLEMPSQDIPASWRLVCDKGSLECLWIEQRDEMLTLLHANRTAGIPGLERPLTVELGSTVGSRHRFLAGSLVSCASLEQDLHPKTTSRSCLLLVLGDGTNEISFATVVLPRTQEEVSSLKMRLTLRSQLTLELKNTTSKQDRSAAPEQVDAVYLDVVQEGRLWILISSGRLELWDFISSRPLTSFALPKGFRGSGLCTRARDGVLLIAGRMQQLPVMLGAIPRDGVAQL
ncbi:FCPF [Symbiodinium sp. CCMP2592]|nr:FCPF [Symbiodinium sp. CCMP2592]